MSVSLGRVKWHVPNQQPVPERPEDQVDSVFEV
jgi:hypothetical protein